jgi:hypothetical protein
MCAESHPRHNILSIAVDMGHVDAQLGMAGLGNGRLRWNIKAKGGDDQVVIATTVGGADEIFYLLGGYPPGEVIDPVGTFPASEPVMRGGSWGSSALVCRSAQRGANPPPSRSKLIGFRIVLVQSH